MILYHGSYTVVDKPDLIHSRDNIDFGKGFYTTPIYEQSVKWSERFKLRGQNSIISEYEYDDSADNMLNILCFDSYSEKWLNFILKCRRGQDSTDYDLIIGGIVNDMVFNTVEFFFDGLIDKDEAIDRLRYEKPNLQMAFKTEKALLYLHFKGSEII